MKRLNFLLAALLLSFPAVAQSLHYYPTNSMKASNGTDTLMNAFAGGLVHPMFSMMDLNGDGLKDMVVFDRWSERLSCYLAKRAGSTKFEYSPTYSMAFPTVLGWMWLVDYDHDGKPDLFTMSDPSVNSSGMAVYRNVSTPGKPAFKALYPSLKSCFSSGNGDIYFNSTEIPAIADMDGDGDMDILTYAGETIHVRYYKNLSEEKYKNADSFKLSLADQCFGRFYEYADTTRNVIVLASTCGEYLVCHNKKEHAGSSLLAYDMDNDGDMDLVIGDASFPGVNYAENGRNPRSAHPFKIDSITSLRTDWPSSTSLNIGNMPQPCLVDVNNDGILDMVAANTDVSSALDKDFIWYYSNINNNKEPVFKLENKNFLDETMIDPGTYSAPAFCDYNHDGKPDLLLSVSNNEVMGHFNSRFYLYENMGTATKAFYTLINDDYMNMADKNYQMLIPFFADLNGDGKEDLLTGDLKGEVLWYRNIGTSKLSKYAAIPDTLKYVTNGSRKNISVGISSAPAMADLNGDGKADLLVGSGGGNLYYYKNISTDTIPLFSLVENNYGSLGVAGNSKAMPFVTDLDKDGHPDLLVGYSPGKVMIYHDVDQQTEPFTPEQNTVYDYFHKNFSGYDFGYDASPAAALLDGDTIPDILVGSYAGGLQLMASTNHGDTFLDVPHQMPQAYTHLLLFPNPAQHTVTVQWENDQAASGVTISVLDLMGRSCLQSSFHSVYGENSQTLNVSGLSAGVYLLRLQSSGQYPAGERLIITR